MTNLISFITPINLTSYTLIIPAVSIGNVPQLTVDLLINSFNFEKIATIWHPAFVSLVGGDPFKVDNMDICTACEMYANKNLKLLTLQIRSTVIKGLAENFFDTLKNTIQTLEIDKVVMLTSSYDYELHNITGPKFFYISNDNEIKDIAKTINLQLMNKDFNDKYIIHGGGFAVRLYDILNEILSCTIVIKYVSEGDNTEDAIKTVEILYNLLDPLKNVNFSIRIPHSWKYAYGGPPPEDMY